jgi:hypothetical protein
VTSLKLGRCAGVADPVSLPTDTAGAAAPLARPFSVVTIRLRILGWHKRRRGTAGDGAVRYGRHRSEWFAEELSAAVAVACRQVVPALWAFGAGGRGDRLEDCLLRLERAGGSVPARSRSVNLISGCDRTSRTCWTGVSHQSAAALRPVAVVV